LHIKEVIFILIRSMAPPSCLFTSRDRDVTSGGIVAVLLLAFLQYVTEPEWARNPDSQLTKAYPSHT